MYVEPSLYEQRLDAQSGIQFRPAVCLLLLRVDDQGFGEEGAGGADELFFLSPTPATTATGIPHSAMTSVSSSR
jgi:hypothetical protein